MHSHVAYIRPMYINSYNAGTPASTELYIHNTRIEELPHLLVSAKESLPTMNGDLYTPTYDGPNARRGNMRGFGRIAFNRATNKPMIFTGSASGFRGWVNMDGTAVV